MTGMTTLNFAEALAFLRSVTSQQLDSFTFSSMYNASFLRERPFREILGLRAFMQNLQTVMFRTCKFYITFQCILILKFINLHFTKDILELAVTVLSLHYYWSKPRSLQLLVQGNGDRGISEIFLPLCLFSHLSQLLLLTTELWGKKHIHVLST